MTRLDPCFPLRGVVNGSTPGASSEVAAARQLPWGCVTTVGSRGEPQAVPSGDPSRDVLDRHYQPLDRCPSTWDRAYQNVGMLRTLPLTYLRPRHDARCSTSRGPGSSTGQWNADGLTPDDFSARGSA